MNSDRSKKEAILQQLKCISKRYEELLGNFDERESVIQKPKEHKRSWFAFFKRDKKNAKTTYSNDESDY
ncbi:MAG: hypothetical protein PHG06_21855 [Parabacteroides sp.]|nr:hypothetical protein [Parabacteroides sp.]